MKWRLGDRLEMMTSSTATAVINDSADHLSRGVARIALAADLKAETLDRNHRALGLPAIAAALLPAWNWSGSGHVSGFIEQSGTAAITRADIGSAIRYLRAIPLAPNFVRNHLWSGGWGF